VVNGASEDESGEEELEESAEDADVPFDSDVSCRLWVDGGELAATACLPPLLLRAGSLPETSWKKIAAQATAKTASETAAVRLRMRWMCRRRRPSRAPARDRAAMRSPSWVGGGIEDGVWDELIFITSISGVLKTSSRSVPFDWAKRRVRLF
jgi:hypothetical protein